MKFLINFSNELLTKDVNEGHEGIVEGFADADGAKVILKLTLKGADGKGKTMSHAVYPRNLQLTSEYKLAKAGEPACKPGKPSSSKDSKEPAEPESDTKHAPKWILGDSDPKDVYMETKWAHLLADADDLTKVTYLKGRQSLQTHACSTND